MPETGPLDGIRVLEIADGRVSALVGMLLADFGADVIRVEPDHVGIDDEMPHSAVLNRGKRSVHADDDWLAAAVAGADVVLLGARAELRPAARAAAAANSRLIEASFPSWLPGKTPWAGGRESHGLLCAYGAVAWRQSSTDGSPVELVAPYVHGIQAAWAATCVVAALYERGEDGYGQRVTVSGVNGLMKAMAIPFAVDPNLPDVPTNAGSLGRHATYRPFLCRDGLWLSSGALGQAFEVRLLKLLGVAHILGDPRINGSSIAMRRPENLGWCTALVEQAFLREDRDHWVSVMRAAGLPVEPVARREDLLDHEQVLAAGLRVDLVDPARGPVMMPGVSIKLMESPGKVGGPAPVAGANTGIAPWPAQPRPAGQRRYKPGALAGVRVLNTGTFVATPYAGVLLSMLGAEVIKVERTEGDPFRLTGYAVNRGMKSIAIDVTDGRGREAFYRLAAKSDAVVDGMRPGVMKRLGLDHDSLARLNPEIVTMSLSAYGEVGPYRDLPGVDMAVQGLTGMMDAQGEDNQPVCSSIALIDVCTASMSALAVTLGLFHRARSGRGQHISNSLLGTACYLQIDDLARYANRPPLRKGGVDFHGHEWSDRFYQTADGWIRVDATEARMDALEALVAGGVLLAGTDPEHVAERLTDSLAQLGTDDALSRLRDLGIPAIQARRVSGVLSDAELVEAETFHFTRSEAGETLCLAGRYASFSRTPNYGQFFPPGIGEHSVETLKEAGVSESEIEALLSAGLLVDGKPMPKRLGEIYR